MSDKMTCPACNSETSAVLRRYEEGEPCPYCGLPASVAEQVSTARERGASQGLVESTAKAELRATKAEKETARLRTALVGVQRFAAEALRSPNS